LWYIAQFEGVFRGLRVRGTQKASSSFSIYLCQLSEYHYCITMGMVIYTSPAVERVKRSMLWNKSFNDNRPGTSGS
jgi:hypothetical protein